MTTIKTILMITLFWGFGSILSAQLNTTAIGQVLNDRYENELSGASILISKEGTILFEKQFGLANVEFEQTISSDTKFAIGSVTKQFTAAAILILQEKGELNINDPITNFIENLNKDIYKKVTIKQLLTHTSGIASDNAEKQISKNLRNNISPSDILAVIINEPLLFAPGDNYDYSNNGYVLLGLIIEKISGMNYASFIEEHISRPLGMKNTQVGFYQDIVENRAIGYTSNDDGEVVNASYHSASYGAEGLISTPRDLNLWQSALFGNKVINKESLSLMLNDYQLNNGDKIGNGFGWEINEISGYPSFEHSGFEPGYKINTIYIPAKEIYVVVMQNNEMGSPTPTSIKLAALALNKPYPQKSESKKATDALITEYTGTYKLDNGQERYIGFNNGHFYYKKPGGIPSELYLNDNGALLFNNEYIQLLPSENGMLFNNRHYSSELVKISNELPKENIAVEIDTKILEKYIGSYESDMFVMHITLNGNRLFAQPEGSDKLQLVSKGGNTFFIEEIGAEIEFIIENGSQYADLINIILEGNKMEGKRIAG